MGDLLADYLPKYLRLNLTLLHSFELPIIANHPSAIVVDIDHHPDPIELLRELRNEHPHSRLLVLTSFVSDYIIHNLTLASN